MRNIQMTSKRRTFIAGLALVGVFASGGAYADPEYGIPSAADETTPSMSTLLSIDRFTGGYKGWGPIANLQVPATTAEAGPNDTFQEDKDRADALAAVYQARENVWVANASQRAPYETANIGATRAEAATGMVRFNSSQQQ